MAERRTRRSTVEVRRLVLEAASREFADKGYEGATMRACADGAGISLSVLHHHFPSKDRLYAETALAPFFASLEEFADTWQAQVGDPWTEEDLMAALIRDLYTHLTTHRPTLVRLAALAEVDVPDAEVVGAIRAGVERLVAGLGPIGAHEAGVRGWFEPEAVRGAVRMTLAMVSGLVLMEPWMADDDADEPIRTATRFALYGVRQTPPDTA